MGASSSVPFSDEQKAAITKKMLAFYNAPENAGKSTVELHHLFKAEYDKAVGELTHPTSPVLPTKEDTFVSPDKAPMSTKAKKPARDGLLQRSFDREEASGRSKKERTNKPTRRRSFDPESRKAAAPTAAADSIADALEKATSAVSQSQSSPQLDITETAVDSWDSVTTQPYCDLCKMAFKNKAFLERHIKYSNLHAQNVQATESGQTHTHLDSVAETPEVPPVVEAAPAPTTAEPQEEGKHYRLLYSGSKFYWRTQQNVDFDIYHHFEPRVIEIIPHNNTHQKELARVYLRYDRAVEMVSKAVEDEVEFRVKDILADRFSTPPNRDAIREDVKLQKLVTFLLSRLQFENEGDHGVVKVAQLSGDVFAGDFIYTELPDTVRPIKVTRRRRSSAEEIDETIHNVAASLETASKLSLEATSHIHRATTWDEHAHGGPEPALTPE